MARESATGRDVHEHGVGSGKLLFGRKSHRRCRNQPARSVGGASRSLRGSGGVSSDRQLGRRLGAGRLCGADAGHRAPAAPVGDALQPEHTWHPFFYRGGSHCMKVVILAGGLGTRLAEETEVKPKPMVEIGGHPILWHIMKHYGHLRLQRIFHRARLSRRGHQAVLSRLLSA